jgi:predicted nuclease of predicted toxin-antitoxin system
MKFITDVSIPTAVVEPLRGSGHNVVRARDLQMERADDADIMARARDEGRIVVTHDVDFGDLLAASGDRLPSVIVLRVRAGLPALQAKRLAAALDRYSLELEHGALAVVTAGRVRLRTLPLDTAEGA